MTPESKQLRTQIRNPIPTWQASEGVGVDKLSGWGGGFENSTPSQGPEQQGVCEKVPSKARLVTRR
eukprot:2465409-Alexandrium_andersonii.AAC.1